MTKCRNFANMISNLSANASKAITVNSGETELVFGDAGSTDLYGFAKTDSDGDNNKENLVLTKTNGADAMSVANNDGTQSDLYNESFFTKQNLTFSVNSNGELTVSV